MTLLQGLMLLIVAVAATGVVLSRDLIRQAIAVSFYGVLLGVMFVLFQAPDVGLSQIAVGAVAYPLMIVLAIAKVRGRAE